jgi:hypothetical protein
MIDQLTSQDNFINGFYMKYIGKLEISEYFWPLAEEVHMCKCTWYWSNTKYVFYAYTQYYIALKMLNWCMHMYGPPALGLHRINFVRNGKFFSFFFKNYRYIKINSRIWIGSVNSNFHFKECMNVWILKELVFQSYVLNCS